MAGRTVTAAEVSQAQLDRLGERMDRGFTEIKDLLKAYEERLRGLETREAGCSPLMTSRMTAAWNKIDQHELDIVALRKSVDGLVLTAQKQESIIKWAAGILAAVIISGAVYLLGRLIYLAVTHQ